MSRNGSSVSYYHTASPVPAAAGSRGSPAGAGSPFFSTPGLLTSRREREVVPLLPQPSSIPRSQQQSQQLNSPDVAFHAHTHLIHRPHPLHGSPSSLLHQPTPEGGLNNDMDSHTPNHQPHHTNQVYRVAPYHARELGESHAQSDLSIRHGNLPAQQTLRSFGQHEYVDNLGTPSNAELARAIEALGSTLGGQISHMRSQIASLLQLTSQLVQLQQDPEAASAASRQTASAVTSDLERQQRGNSATDAPSWNPTWASEASSGTRPALSGAARPDSTSTIVYTEAAAPAPPSQLGSPYTPVATTATSALHARPLSRGFLQAFGATRLPGVQSTHKEQSNSEDTRGALPLPRCYFNDVDRYEGRNELKLPVSVSPRAPTHLRAATVGPTPASSETGGVVPHTARLHEIPPPLPRRGSEPHPSPEHSSGSRGQVGTASLSETHPPRQAHTLVLQLMRETEMTTEINSFEATAMGSSGSLDGAGLVPARSGQNAVRQEPTRSNSNSTVPRDNASSGPSCARANTSCNADGVDELALSPDSMDSKPEHDWKFWSEYPPGGKGLPLDFKPKYATMAEVRRERKSLTKRTMATIGRIPLKEYLEVGEDYLAVRRTGRKCVAQWLQPLTRMSKQDPLRITACIHKLEHDHPILAVCEDHWKARACIQQTIDNAFDEHTLLRRKAEKLAGRGSAAGDTGALATGREFESRDASHGEANRLRRSADTAELDEGGRSNQRARVLEAGSLHDAMNGVGSSAVSSSRTSDAAFASPVKGVRSTTATRGRRT